jgi:spermidine synthase
VFIAFLALLLTWSVKANSIQIGIMATGFTSSSIEIALLFIFQVIFGYMFLMVGMIILVFMAGLFLGAISGRKFLPVPAIKHLIMLQMSMAVICLFVTGAVGLFGSQVVYPLTSHAIILLLVLITAIIAGLQFQWSARVHPGTPSQVSGGLYSADLLGSAAGTLLVSTLLIPVLGIITTLYLIAAFNIMIGVIMLLKRKNLVVV